MGIRLIHGRLSAAAAMASLDATGLGGVVLFAGRVRPDRVRGGRVAALFYESDEPFARRQLEAMERTARRRFGAERVVLWHRLGIVRTGEISVIIGAACGHRDPAFRAVRFLIEELKRSVPIWKTDRVRLARRPQRPPSRRRARSSG